MSPGQFLRNALRTIPRALAHRCPKCGEGHVFGGFLQMNHRCPHCGLLFNREAGYFVGAMYVSYALALLIGIPLWILFVILDLEVVWLVTTAGLIVATLSPWIFRLSRVIWIHFDFLIDPWQPKETTSEVPKCHHEEQRDEVIHLPSRKANFNLNAEHLTAGQGSQSTTERMRSRKPQPTFANFPLSPPPTQPSVLSVPSVVN